jgi:hypothetical protein
MRALRPHVPADPDRRERHGAVRIGRVGDFKLESVHTHAKPLAATVRRRWANRRDAAIKQERAHLSRTAQDFLPAVTRLLSLPLCFANIEPYRKENTYG